MKLAKYRVVMPVCELEEVVSSPPRSVWVYMFYHAVHKFCNTPKWYFWSLFLRGRINCLGVFLGLLSLPYKVSSAKSTGAPALLSSRLIESVYRCVVRVRHSYTCFHAPSVVLSGGSSQSDIQSASRAVRQAAVTLVFHCHPAELVCLLFFSSEKPRLMLCSR